MKGRMQVELNSGTRKKVSLVSDDKYTNTGTLIRNRMCNILLIYCVEDTSHIKNCLNYCKYIIFGR